MNNRQRQTYHDVLHSIKNNDPTLNGASLQGCNIDDQGAQDLADALQRNTALSVIDLYNNQIGDQGAQALADALQRNTALTEIYLHENQIGDQGAQALAVALQKNTTVTSIYLRANQIGDEGAQALAEALQRNTTVTVIYLDANQILNNSIVNRINELCQRNKNDQVLAPREAQQEPNRRVCAAFGVGRSYEPRMTRSEPNEKPMKSVP